MNKPFLCILTLVLMLISPSNYGVLQVLDSPADKQKEQDLREYEPGTDDVEDPSSEVTALGNDEFEVTDESEDVVINDDSPFSELLTLVASKKKKKKSRRCNCSSGCGMIIKGLKPKIAAYRNNALKIGISPVSCIRTQKCQNTLRACFERCGQKGRAAKKSSHSDGKACDYSKKYGKKLNPVRKKHGINRLVHGSEGGGLHDYQK